MSQPIFFLFLAFMFGAVEEKEIAHQAHTAYLKGETATMLGEREDAFNQALTLYKKLEETYDPTFGNGKLYYNIGNSYFQLGQLPLAAYYYYKAEKLMPRSEDLEKNLTTTLAKLGTLEPKKRSFIEISLPEQLQLFTLFSVLTLLFLSFYVWKSQFKKLSQFFGLISFALLLSLAYTHYFTPLEGVITKSTSLYRDAGFQYAKVSDEPILSGEKVEILDSIREGAWLKVITKTGELGFVPKDSIRTI